MPELTLETAQTIVDRRPEGRAREGVQAARRRRLRRSAAP